MRKEMNILISLSLLAVTIISGCQKTEFMPPPQGEPIPYEDPKYADLATLLAESPYQLFHQVWTQSSVETDILQGKTPHTILVPDDAAMKAAGYTAASITEMSTAEADSMVWFYTVPLSITKENLAENIGSFRAISLLERPDWMMELPYSYQPGAVTYRYSYYLATEGDRFLVNGVVLGDTTSAMHASNGFIWPINKLISVPNKEFKTVLESDERFTMLVELKRRSDEVHDLNYRAVAVANEGWDPGPETDFLRAFYNRLQLTMAPTGQAYFNTLFLPTNAAFVAAGFNSVDEILEWNKRGPDLIYDPFEYPAIRGGGFPSDTIVAFHFDWGRENLPYSGQWGKAPDPTPTVFYVNDLRNDFVGGYLINNRVGDLEYSMPYDFGKDAQGRVQLQVKGSDAPPATIIETINTAMGPIHVVDRLLIPKNLKIN